MAAAAPPHNDGIVVPAPAAAQQLNNKQTTIVYERDLLREIRVLDAKIGKLELQLNDELEKISSCSGLLEEIIAKPPGSPCSSVRAELGRVRAKRDKAYHKLQLKQQQQLEMETPPGDGEAAAASAAASN